jgi:hypothetical protein
LRALDSVGHVVFKIKEMAAHFEVRVRKLTDNDSEIEVR